MTFLLDTNVLSELGKSRPSLNVATWIRGVSEDDLRISVLVLGQLRHRVDHLRRRDPQQADGLDRWLDLVKRDYADRLVPVTEEVAEEWGRLTAIGALSSDDNADGLMAATALVYDWTLVTRNTKHVERTGVRLVNPFEP